MSSARKHSRHRSREKLLRAKPTRPPYKRILIVCEGSKTEPNYFNEIRKKYRLPTAHIKILGSELGTEPLQVIESALAEFNRAKAFDMVFVVFDRDDHRTFYAAIKKVEGLDKAIKNDERQFVEFKYTISIPCFEVWLLKHYRDVHAFNHRDEVFDDLKSHIAGYAKGNRDVFEITEPLLDDAKRRANRSRERNSEIKDDEPFTNVDELVEVLMNLRQ